jgi:hypothetical protein
MFVMIISCVLLFKWKGSLIGHVNCMGRHFGLETLDKARLAKQLELAYR